MEGREKATPSGPTLLQILLEKSHLVKKTAKAIEIRQKHPSLDRYTGYKLHIFYEKRYLSNPTNHMFFLSVTNTLNWFVLGFS